MVEKKEKNTFEKLPSNYEIITQLKALPIFNKMLVKTILPMYWVDYSVIYEFYCQEKAKGEKPRQCVTNTAEEYNISEQHVYKIKRRMES